MADDPRDKKREDYLKWDEYFMSLAFLSAQRSKDPELQVGACIVNEEDGRNIVVSLGYNGMPILPTREPPINNDDVFSWKRKHKSEYDNKHLYVCNATMNAIVNKNSADIKGCTIYLSNFPCNESAKLIIQSGIKKVVFCWNKKWETPTPSMQASLKMLQEARVRIVQHIPERMEIVINFSHHKHMMPNGAQLVTKL